METLATLKRYDGAVLRFYSAEKDIVATCVFGNPAFEQGGDADTFVSTPIAPDMKPPGGVMAFAMIQIRDARTPVGPITVGLEDSDAVFKFDTLLIERGAMLSLGAMTIRNMEGQAQALRDLLEKALKPKFKAAATTTRKKKRITEQGANAAQVIGTMPARIKDALLIAGPDGLNLDEIAEAIGDDVVFIVEALNTMFHTGDVENA